MTPLDAALAYAGRGWRVLPVHEPVAIGICSCPNGEACGRDTGKHPRTLHGKSDATIDEGQIRKWWRRWPTANIGVALPDERFLVVDLDPRDDGDISWERICSLHEPLPPTVYARTGGGGWHGLYGRPAGVELRGKLARGVDLPSSYFLVAPSFHASGQRYEWIRSPFEHPVAEAPSWLVEMASARACVPSTGRTASDPGEETHRPPIGPHGPDTSDSGKDASEAIRLVRRGATDAEIANVLRARPSYRKRLLRGENIAEDYIFKRTIAFARSCGPIAVRQARIFDVYLDARRPFGSMPAWAVLKLTLVTPDGEPVPRAHVVVPGPGYESSRARFEAVCGDLDVARLMRGDAEYAREHLKGQNVRAVIDGRDVPWIERVSSR